MAPGAVPDSLPALSRPEFGSSAASTEQVPKRDEPVSLPQLVVPQLVAPVQPRDSGAQHHGQWDATSGDTGTIARSVEAADREVAVKLRDGYRSLSVRSAAAQKARYDMWSPLSRPARHQEHRRKRPANSGEVPDPLEQQEQITASLLERQGGTTVTCCLTLWQRECSNLLFRGPGTAASLSRTKEERAEFAHHRRNITLETGKLHRQRVREKIRRCSPRPGIDSKDVQVHAAVGAPSPATSGSCGMTSLSSSPLAGRIGALGLDVEHLAATAEDEDFELKLPSFTKAYVSPNRVRGYAFQATQPCTIVRLCVPDDDGLGGMQNVQVVRFHSEPCDYDHSLGDHTPYETLFHTSAEGETGISTDLEINAGDWIGVLGCRGHDTHRTMYAGHGQVDAAGIGKLRRLVCQNCALYKEAASQPMHTMSEPGEDDLDRSDGVGRVYMQYQVHVPMSRQNTQRSHASDRVQFTLPGDTALAMDGLQLEKRDSRAKFSAVVEAKLNEIAERRETTVLCKLHLKTTLAERCSLLRRNHLDRVQQRKLQELEDDQGQKMRPAASDGTRSCGAHGRLYPGSAIRSRKTASSPVAMWRRSGNRREVAFIC